jgi:ketosteroid isomerase-like protein
MTVPLSPLAWLLASARYCASVSHDNVENLRKAIDDFNRRHFDDALALMREDATWEPFLSRAETSLIRGKEQIRAAWESQVAAVDLHAEPDDFIAIGDDKVVVPMRLIAHGRRSDMSLTASVIWVWTFDDEGLSMRVEAFDSREDALRSANKE